MALGVALLFVAAVHAQDNDGNGACLNVGTMFERVEPSEVGLRAYVRSLGVNWNDFDGDGDVDLFVAAGPSTVEHGAYHPGEDLLYLNQGDMTFVEAGAEAGLDDLCEDRAPMFGDLDNDGTPDLYVTVNGQNVWYRNLGGGKYEDITAQAGAAGHMGWGHQGFLFDYDRDGYLDVFFTNGPEDGSGFNALLRNQRDGTMRETTWDAGVAGAPSGKGSCVLDVNNDGWQDIFVATGREYGNQLFVNQGDGTFIDEALERNVSDPMQRFGVGANCGDLDNDGDDDIMLITHDKVWSGNQLFENVDGVFYDVAEDVGIMDFVDGHGSAMIDLDLDGLLDMVLSGIRTTPYVFMNQGDMQFTRICYGGGINQTGGLSWSVTGADITGDAYPEVYIANGLGRRPRDGELFQNAGGTNHSLTIHAVGLTHNPSAIGARIEVSADGVTRYRTVGTWSSFDSQAPLPVTIGLGSATTAETVRVVFTNGAEVVLNEVAADQTLTVTEPEDWADADHDGVPDEWDACPGTRVGYRTDGEGCAVGQRRGVAVGIVGPAKDSVVVDPPTFEWSGTVTRAVVQVSRDGTFGPAGRFDFGPVTASTLTPSAEQWADLLAEVDGTRALVWRVVAMDDDGGQAITDPRRLYAAVPSNRVEIPLGANIFMPAHIVVEPGTTVTFWNDSVSNGNLQNEPHDVQLLDPEGLPRSTMKELNGGGFFTWTFDAPGTWYYMCHRHSGDGAAGDATSETHSHLHAEGPYRCMTGTVTVRNADGSVDPWSGP